MEYLPLEIVYMDITQITFCPAWGSYSPVLSKEDSY